MQCGLEGFIFSWISSLNMPNLLRDDDLRYVLLKGRGQDILGYGNRAGELGLFPNQ